MFIEKGYFYNNSFQTNPPQTEQEFLIVFNFIPVGSSTVYDESISFFDENLKEVQNKKVVLIAHDEGLYGSYIDGIYKDDFFEKLHKWSKESKNKIHFISHNLISDEVVSKHNYSFKAHGLPFFCENYLRDYHLYDDLCNDRFNLNLIEKTFITYNNKFRIHRIYSYYKFNQLKLQNSALYFQHADGYNSPYLDLIYNNYPDRFDLDFYRSIDFSKKIIPNNLPENKMEWGQELHYEDYNKTFLSLVSETEVGNDTIYFSEKTFKPIVMLHPFLLISSPNSLKKLKELGYKTFDKWWDESYDECDNLFDRIDKIYDVIVKLNNFSKKELFELRLEMKDVLIYNYNKYKERSKIHFLNKKLEELLG